MKSIVVVTKAKLAGALLLLSLLCVPVMADESAGAVAVEVFTENDIHFLPDSAGKYATDDVISEDNGRVISRTVDLPEYEGSVEITAYLALHPIPKDIQSVYDKWDRAGNVRLSVEGMPDIEIVKFVTSYGGFTEYEIDVSHLAQLLRGPVTIRGFIDTWVSPGWKMDFSLFYQPVEQADNANWAQGLVFVESFNEKDMGEQGVEVEVDIPESINRVVLNYLVSGHCTDGTDADEFVSKDNVISVDGTVVFRYKPWRDDCRQFREINPYCRRWSQGYWSSDFSRSGWCPGDWVEPLALDLTDHLTPGPHTVRFMIEDIRPEGEDGHFGYWRVSCYLVGYEEK